MDFLAFKDAFFFFLRTSESKKYWNSFQLPEEIKKGIYTANNIQDTG